MPQLNKTEEAAEPPGPAKRSPAGRNARPTWALAINAIVDLPEYVFNHVAATFGSQHTQGRPIFQTVVGHAQPQQTFLGIGEDLPPSKA
jgi:hypothetical protein